MIYIFLSVVALLTWYLLGAAITLHTCFMITPVINRMDRIVAFTGGGLMGPLMFLWWFPYGGWRFLFK